MNNEIITPLLYFYGFFLIACGIISVIFIGAKAKTALLSGSISGMISLTIAYLVGTGINIKALGITFSLALLIVFSWRSAKTLFKIFEIIPSFNNELKGKGIAFLIISLMAVVSMFVSILQIIIFF